MTLCWFLCWLFGHRLVNNGETNPTHLGCWVCGRIIKVKPEEKRS